MARLKKMTYAAVDVASALCPRDVPDGGVSEADWRASSLAGEALVEIGLKEVRTHERHQQVLARVQSWLTALLERGALQPAERAASGDTLARLGDPRFNPDLWDLPDEPLLGFVEIQKGSFPMGSDKNRDQQAYDDELPQHDVFLPFYYMGRYPVTVAQFRAFAEQSGYKPKDPDRLKGIENHPVVDVTWHDAMALLRLAGGKAQGMGRYPGTAGKVIAKRGERRATLAHHLTQ